jgi:deoxycytidine triphosphate deaminase
MVLPDIKISSLISEGKIVINPFNEKRLTPQGYDISLEDFSIKPGEFKIFKTIERIEVPNNLLAIPFLRTTYAFKGLILSPGIIDAGFKGHLKIALYNSGTESITAEKADHVIAPVHLIFLKIDGDVGLSFGERADEILG